MMKLSFFNDFTSTQVMERTMDQVVGLIRSDRQIQSITDGYRATKSKDVKSKSPLFAVACRFRGGKRKEHITELTGLSLVDFDHVCKAPLDEIMAKIIADPHTMMCYTTVSGEGLRVIFRYELDESMTLAKQIQQYAQVFEAGNVYYEQLLGIKTDRQCKNVTRLSGLAHDAKVYYNESSLPIALPSKGSSILSIENKKNITDPMPKSKGTVERACQRAKRTLDRREQFTEGNHHNYLVKLLLQMADYGVPETEAADFLSREFPDYHGEDFDKLAASCYNSANGGKATKAELIVEFLANKPLRYDVLSRKIQTFLECKTSKRGGTWTDLTERMTNDLLYDCNKELGMNISKTMFMPMLMSEKIPEVNPLREYISSLPEWDGQRDYIGEVAGMVHIADDNGQWLTCFRKWLCAMVASWMTDEVVNHQVLVLIGPQGIFKTTWLDSLMPPQLVQYRSKQSSAGHLDKDEMLRSTEFGLINMDEIDRMSESELNQLKSLITASDVNVRSPYAFGKERRIRVASYVASGNKERFLTDQTGNRRWLPFNVESIESPFLHPLPYEGLYAQAWHLVQSGYAYWFSLDEIRQLEQHVSNFEVETNEEQLLPVYFKSCPAGTPNALFLTVAEISAKLIMYGNIKKPMDIRKLGALLKKMGFISYREARTGRRGVILIELTADQINAQRKLMAM